MPLLSIVIALVIIGVILYLVELLPIDATIKLIIRVIVIVALLIWLLQILVGLPGLPTLIR